MPGSHIRKRVSEATGKTTFMAVFLYTDSATGHKRTRSKTFELKRDAARWLGEQKKRRDETGFVAPEKATVSEWMDLWLAGFRGAESTKASYRTISETYVKPNLGAVKLGELAPDHVDEMIRRLERSGLSPTTVRYAVTVLRIALESAVKKRKLPFNPAKADAISLPKKEASNSRPRSMSAEEAKAFIAALDGEAHRPLLLTLIYTGLRPGEALALQWRHVCDLRTDRPFLDVRRALQRDVEGKAHFAQPKTKRSTRQVPLPKVAAEALRLHREQAMKKGRHLADDLVFPSRGDKAEPLRRDNLRRTFVRVCKKAGLTEPVARTGSRGPDPEPRSRFTLYDLRHTYACLQLDAEVDLATVSLRLGHKSAEFTATTYCHKSQIREDRATSKLEALLG